MKTLAFIPARAGSVGIPNKNTQRLGDRPLYQWALGAALNTQGIDHTVLSTDIPDLDVSRLSRENSFEIHKRPAHLTNGLSYTITDVVLDYLNTNAATYDLVALFQPTSPFVQPAQVEACIDTLTMYEGGLSYNSAQTICEIPHNYHAFNQRVLKGDSVEFAFRQERDEFPHKQDKPVFYKFGNMVVARVSHLYPGKSMFPGPCWSYMVDWKHAMDIDTPGDLELANLMYGMELIP